MVETQLLFGLFLVLSSVISWSYSKAGIVFYIPTMLINIIIFLHSRIVWAYQGKWTQLSGSVLLFIFLGTLKARVFVTCLKAIWSNTSFAQTMNNWDWSTTCSRAIINYAPPPQFGQTTCFRLLLAFILMKDWTIYFFPSYNENNPIFHKPVPKLESQISSVQKNMQSISHCVTLSCIL